MEIYDAVIAGGGPAGAAAALTLARSGRRVLLLNARDPEFKIGESLPPATGKLLQRLGVWNEFILDNHLPCYGNLSAWGSSYLQSADTVFDPHGNAWHLDRVRFDALLRKKAHEAGARIEADTVLRRCGVSTIKNESLWSLSAVSENRKALEVKSRFVIDASGRRSIVARSQGVRRIADDKLVACYVLFASPADDLDSRTIVESVPEGWWYSVLLPDRRRVVAFHTDADLLKSDFSIRALEEFISHLQKTEHINRIIVEKDYLPVSVPKVTSANSARLETSYGKGWIAAGDSAAAFDPLSSQGIMIAIYAGMMAGEAADAYLSGNFNALGEYNQALTKIYAVYHRNLQNWYALEKRWQNYTFWERRLDLSKR